MKKMIGKPGFLGKNFKNTFFFAIQSKIIAQSVDGDVKSAHCFPRTPSILVFSECWLGCTSKADDPWFYRTQKTLPSLWNTAYKSWQMYFLCSQFENENWNNKPLIFIYLISKFVFFFMVTLNPIKRSYTLLPGVLFLRLLQSNFYYIELL